MGRKEPTRPNRLAIIDTTKCKPQDCNLECKKACPVNRIGKQCITVTHSSIHSSISEILCIGCSACVKKCPFNAITIVNLPTSLESEVTHRYTANGFKLHRLPVLKLGKVVGLVGTNGIGKSTALKIMAGKLKMNLGRFEDPPEWNTILNNFKGSELHGFFTKILEEKMKCSFKIQYVDKVPQILLKKFGTEKVDELITKMDTRDKREEIVRMLSLADILERKTTELSGGELQRLYIALICLQKSDVYFFDEPSSYLDVKQRIAVANAIRSLADNAYVVVVEHDLAILDLMSDYGCVLYGISGAYGVITSPFSIKNAINIFLDGFVPTENMRFRTEALCFDKRIVGEAREEEGIYKYESMYKTFDGFKLCVEAGDFKEGEVILFLGENGMGKTTLVNLLAGLLLPDGKGEDDGMINNLNMIKGRIEKLDIKDGGEGSKIKYNEEGSRIEKLHINDNGESGKIKYNEERGVGSRTEDLNIKDNGESSKIKYNEERGVGSRTEDLNIKDNGESGRIKYNEEGSRIEKLHIKDNGESSKIKDTTETGKIIDTTEISKIKYNEESSRIEDLNIKDTTESRTLSTKEKRKNNPLCLDVSLKPQKILIDFNGSVHQFLVKKIGNALANSNFINDVIKPLNIEYVYESKMCNLSGGELQRVSIAACLGRNAAVYLFDEPSAYLDADQRIVVSRVIKKFMIDRKKTCFVVEHDLIVGTYLADRIVVFEGRPGINSVASSPLQLENGMNRFLKNIGVTFRRDPENYRPRVNKPGSAKDTEQKATGNYFYT